MSLAISNVHKKQSSPNYLSGLSKLFYLMADQNELCPIFKIVDEFASTTFQQRFEIPFELTNKQRSAVHEYIKQKGLYSESIQLKGSSNKKIAVCRHEQVEKKTKTTIMKHFDSLSFDTDNKQATESASVEDTPDTSDFSSNLATRTENIDFFAQYTRAPFPCPSPDYVDYYVKLFDPFFDTVQMWDLFNKESKRLILRKEAADASRKIRDAFSQNKEYVKMMELRLKGVETKMKKDVYSIPNISKYFLSIDIKTANFTVLRKSCPSLFTSQQGDLMSWQQFVKQFTDSEFICQSKYFRELVFGMTGFINKAGILQEILMDKVHQSVMDWSSISGVTLTPRMKCGDENVYEVSDPETVITQIASLRSAIGPEVDNLHFRIFRVDQIEQKVFFVKTFLYNSDWEHVEKESRSLKSKIEFKKVPKFFMPQVIKWYRHEKIQDEDLIFMHEGIIAQYKATIFE